MTYWEAIIPFLIIIPVAIWTKQVIPGLTLGLLVASYMVEPTLLGGITKATDYVISNLAKENKLYVIGFLYLFAGIINLVKVTGGIQGFIDVTSKKIKTRRQTFGLIWLTILGTFSSPNLRIVTVAPIIKVIQKRVDITKERLGFVIEATGLPIIALIPVATAFIGYMTGTIELALQSANLSGDPYKLFIQSIPYNFFSIVIIVLALPYTLIGHPTLNNNKKKKKEEAIEKVDEEFKSRPINLYIPVLTALVLSIFLSWWNGYQKTQGFFNAFIESNVSKSMFIAILITLMVTVILLLIERYPLKKIIDDFFYGSNNLMPAICIFALVWGLASATNDLQLSQFVAASLGWVPSYLVAPVVFLVGSLLAYFIGSSWGSWGLLMPIGLSMVKVSGIPIPILIGVVFASGTFGGLASPLSGTTIMMSKIMDMEIMQYSRYKLKHCIVPLILTTFGYFIIMFLL